MFEQGSPSLFVGDLAVTCDETDLIDMFTPYGNIVSVRIMRTRKKLTLGYAFVAYDTIQSAKLAMDALNGVSLCGRNMRIAFAALPKGREGADSVSLLNIQRRVANNRNTGSIPTTLTGGHSLHAQREAQVLAASGGANCLLCTFSISSNSPNFGSTEISERSIVALYNHFCAEAFAQQHHVKAKEARGHSVLGVKLQPMSNSVNGLFGTGVLRFVDADCAMTALRYCSYIVHLDVAYRLTLDSANTVPIRFVREVPREKPHRQAVPLYDHQQYQRYADSSVAGSTSLNGYGYSQSQGYPSGHVAEAQYGGHVHMQQQYQYNKYQHQLPAAPSQSHLYIPASSPDCFRADPSGSVHTAPNHDSQVGLRHFVDSNGNANGNSYPYQQYLDPSTPHQQSTNDVTLCSPGRDENMYFDYSANQAQTLNENESLSQVPQQSNFINGNESHATSLSVPPRAPDTSETELLFLRWNAETNAQQGQLPDSLAGISDASMSTFSNQEYY